MPWPFSQDEDPSRVLSWAPSRNNTPVENGLSVRQTEALVKRGDVRAKATRLKTQKDSDTVSLETDLSANLNMKVSIAHKEGSETGVISISYKTLDDLDVLCQMLSATRSAGSK